MAVSLSCSPALQEWLESRVAQLRERAPLTAALLDADEQLATQCKVVLRGSDYVLRSLLRDDGLLQALLQDGLAVARTQDDYIARVATLDAHAGSEAEYARALRQLRRLEMVRLLFVTGPLAS